MEKICFNEDWYVKDTGNPREFSSRREKISLPHDAVIREARDPGQHNGTKKAYFPNGEREYSKVFTVPDSWRGKEIYLLFDGVMSHAKVFLNGSFIQSHSNGYTEFLCPLSGYILYGEKNVLRVLVKTDEDSRWYTGAGIYRDVTLLLAEPAHIAHNGIRISCEKADEKTAVMRLSVSVCGDPEPDAELRLSLYDPALRTVFSGRKERPGEFSVEIPNPALWDAEHPSLYRLETVLCVRGREADRETVRFGIRTLSVSAATGLLVNGRTVRLRGACIHHDNGPLGAAAFRDAEFRKIRKLKEAGFNAVRSAHNPASRNLLDACDELGMYVMEEAFDCWRLPKTRCDYANDFDGCWKEDIAAMCGRDYNHPSVVMYSIGNEISDLAFPGGVKQALEIAAFVKSIDGTRFTTTAMNGILLIMEKMAHASLLRGESETENADVNQKMNSMDEAMESINNAPVMDALLKGGAEAVDIAGYNYMHNRYEPDIGKYPDRVIVGSETYPKLIPEMWRHIETHTNVIGDFTWTGWDYLGETGIGVVSYEERDYHEGFYKEYPCISGGCGDLDITGVRLPQSYFREIVFGRREEPYIAVHNPAHAGETEYLSSWGWGDVISSWAFGVPEGTLLDVDVYGTGECTLFLNGRKIGTNPFERYCCSFRVPYEKGELRAERRDGGKRTEAVLASAEGGTEIRLSAEERTAAKDGLVFLSVSVTDTAGTLLPDSDRGVKLSVSGAEILGYGNGDPMTEEGFAADTHRTYRGRALAVLRAYGGEPVRVKAVSEGLAPADYILFCEDDHG